MINNFYRGTTQNLTFNYIPTDTNVLTITFVKASKVSYTATKDLINNIFTLTITSTDTALLNAGEYSYVIELIEGLKIDVVDMGLVTVLENPALLTTIDNRTHAKKVLEAIEAVIEGRASRDEMKYNINGRYLEKTPLPDLIALRDRYKREYSNEQKSERIKKGLGNPNIIRTRFK